MYQLGVISYFELNRDYIAEVLCINKADPITMCNGACFLDDNLDEADGKNAATSDKRTKIDLPVFLVEKPEPTPGVAACLTEADTHSSEHYSFLVYSSIFHPPPGQGRSL